MIIEIPLNKKIRRPVLMLDSWFPGCRAMLDTGAVCSVWTAPTFQLLKLGAELTKRDESFGSFGGSTTGNLYEVDLRLKDLTYKKLPIIVARQDKLNCHLLLPATMFENMIYTINDKNHIFTLDTCNDKSIITMNYRKSDERLYAHIVEQDSTKA